VHWLILALSSFPLHFIWNSAVFETLATNEYIAVSVTEDFVDGGSWHLPNTTQKTTQNMLSDTIQSVQALAQDHKLQRQSQLVKTVR